jgi:hypothetical protein
MGSPLKTEATIELDDGRRLTFAYDVNAWIDIGEELGKLQGGVDVELPEILKALSDKENPPSLKFQRVIVWGGLRKHHPEMTVRDAGAIMVEAAPAMERAMAGGLPQEEEGSADEAAEGPPMGSPGASSGPGTAARPLVRRRPRPAPVLRRDPPHRLRIDQGPASRRAGARDHGRVVDQQDRRRPQ